VQIREKDLSARQLFELTQKVLVIRGTRSTKILVNSRADVALAAGADGVHLPAAAPQQTLPGLLVGRSCHTVEEVLSSRADLVTFGPTFDSPGKGYPTGLDALREACQSRIPVYALGGITWNNAGRCIEAGAAGIAGIRLFQEIKSDALC
jgi:thiamine-phosphate pyrophosphorylase